MKYAGKFDMGYEAIRELVFEHVRSRWASSPRMSSCLRSIRWTRADEQGARRPDVARNWTSPVPGTRCRRTRSGCSARMAEVYAGFVAHADNKIGRVLDYLEETGQLDNTIVIVVSDNGASGEGGPNGSVNEMKFMNGIPDLIEDNLAYLDELGGPTTYNHYPNGLGVGVQHAVQDVEALQQLRRRYRRPHDRVVARGTACIGGQARSAGSTPTRSTWSRPCWNASTCEFRRRRTRRHADPHRRAQHSSRRSRIRRASTPARPSSISMLGTRAIWHKGWKATSLPHPHSKRAGRLQRDNVGSCTTPSSTRASCDDLADKEPDRLQELIDPVVCRSRQYQAATARRPDARGHPQLAERPQLSQTAQPLRLLPRLTEKCPNPSGREHPQPLLHARRRLEVDRPQRIQASCSPRAPGSAATLSTSKRHRLKYVYNFAGLNEQTARSRPMTLPTGHVIVSASFDKEGTIAGVPTEDPHADHIRDTSVGEVRDHDPTRQVLTRRRRD